MFDNGLGFKALTDEALTKLKKTERLSLEDRIEIQQKRVEKLRNILAGLDEESITVLEKKYKQAYHDALERDNLVYEQRKLLVKDLTENKGAWYLSSLLYSKMVFKPTEAKKVLKEFRGELKQMLREECYWPKPVASAVSRFAYPEIEGEKRQFSDYLIAAEAGGHLPTMYVAPLAKIMKENPKFLTKTSMLWDVGNVAITLGATFAIPEMKDAVTSVIPYLNDSLNFAEGYFQFVLAANNVIKVPQIPYRAITYWKNDGEHTSAPASIFHWNPILLIANTSLFSYDWYIEGKYALEKHKLKSLEKEYKLKNSNNLRSIPLTQYKGQAL